MQEKSKGSVVITGANGLIGSHLVAELSDEGYRVVALVREPEEDVVRVPSAARVLEWHARSTDGEWRGEVAEADAVVNLAGAPLAQRWTEAAKKRIRDSRVLGTRNIVDAMPGTLPDGKPQILVNGSAVGYYGLMRKDPVDESSSPGRGYPSDLCVEWENEATRCREKGARVVLCRSGIVLHPEGGALAEFLTPFRFFLGGPVGDGQQPWPWVHIDDEIGLLRHAIETEELSGPINAVAPEQITNEEFADALGDVLGRPSILHAPRFAVRILLGEAAAVVTGGQRVLPAVAEKTGYSFRFTEIRAALHDLLD